MIKHFTFNRSGTRLCLHELCPAAKARGTVFLVHGTFSNYRSCRGLAGYLCELGYHCWILDCQGHGASDAPVIPPDFESMYLEDTDAALTFLDQRTPGPIWWVGHSGGGLAALMLLARTPARQQSLAGLVTIASQTTDAGKGFGRKLMWAMSSAMTKLIGVVPGKLLKVGPENEFYTVMRQWFGWSIKGTWLGRDGFDYMAALGKHTIPTLTIAAAGDRIIAPASGCRRIHESLGSSSRRFILASKANNFQEDYNHARVISSRSASKDVWPLVADWIQEHS